MLKSFENESPTSVITEKEAAFADELVVLLRQAANEPDVPPWVESNVFLEHEPDLPEPDDDEEKDDTEKETEREEIPFEYRKKCVNYWRNSASKKKRSFSSVQSKFKRLKK